MLGQIADLRLSVLIFLRRYVLALLCPCALMYVPLCIRPYVLRTFICVLLSAPFCQRPYVGFRKKIGIKLPDWYHFTPLLWVTNKLKQECQDGIG